MLNLDCINRISIESIAGVSVTAFVSSSRCNLLSDRSAPMGGGGRGHVFPITAAVAIAPFKWSGYGSIAANERTNDERAAKYNQRDREMAVGKTIDIMTRVATASVMSGERGRERAGC